LIIDFHNHVWPGPPPGYSFAGPERPQSFVDDMLANMDMVGIDKAVIFGPDSHVIAEHLTKHPDRLIGFAHLNPIEVNKAVDDLEFFVREKGFRGLKLGPGGSMGSYYPNDEKIYPLYAKAMELGVPLLIHTGVIHRDVKHGARTRAKYGQPIFLDDIARDFPDLIVIAAHAGRPLLEQTVLLSVNPNVYVDITWSQLPISFYRETVQTVLMAFGPDRIIYGSDTGMLAGMEAVHGFMFGPRRSSMLYAETIQMLRDMNVSQPIIKKIMGENAARVLKL
jgi:predicted TIM-barrel fold metal-dependent hydrolase